MWPREVYPVGNFLVRCHLLVREGEAVLIDTGLVGAPDRLEGLMRKLGLQPRALRAILLTHGHLDHTGGLIAIRAWSGAPVYAHTAEQIHIDGRYPYRRSARVCGWLESAGRKFTDYKPVEIDCPLADGDLLPFWGGLRVIHLPGHTAGHCGFYSERENVLFSGDLFASYAWSVHRAPNFLSTEPSLIGVSLDRVRALDPAGIIPNHYDRCDAKLHLERLRRLP